MPLTKLNKNLRNRDIGPVFLTFITVMLITVGVVGGLMHAESRPGGNQSER